MSSRIEALFSQALGLEAPWQVEKIAFSEADKRLDIYLDFPKGSKFTCPVCRRKGIPAYDTHQKSWRHLNFFQHQALCRRSAQAGRSLRCHPHRRGRNISQTRSSLRFDLRRSRPFQGALRYGRPGRQSCRAVQQRLPLATRLAATATSNTSSPSSISSPVNSTFDYPRETARSRIV